jgi:hypothetical protein
MSDDKMTADKVTAEFSRESLLMFAQLLNEYVLPAGHPELVRLARQTVIAREELIEALKQPNQDEPTDLTTLKKS